MWYTVFQMSEKDKHIDWMNEQDDNAAFVRAAKEEDFASMVEMAPEPELAEGVDLGRLFDRIRAPRDWNGKEWADAVYGPESVTQNYWCDQA